MKPLIESSRYFLLAMGCSALGLIGQVRAADYQWDFSGDLNSSIGNGLLDYAEPSSQAATTFGTTGGGVPNIGGQAASFMRVPAFALGAQGYNATFTSTGPNGGGAYVNQYTFVMDVLSPASINWTPFFNTDPVNGNDADFYIAPDGAIGIGALGYSGVGLITADTWYRIAFSADLGAGTVTFYINGTQVKQRTGASLLEGRFALYSNADAGPDVRLFNEGDGSGVYTHEVLVNSLMFTDHALSASEIAGLGGPNAAGILPVPEPATWTLIGAGMLALLLIRRRDSR